MADDMTLQLLMARVAVLESRMDEIDDDIPEVPGVGGDEGGGMDYDLIVIGGIKYTPGAKTSKFLQICSDGSSSWVPGPIPDVMPTGYEIFDVTKNHIHITGATAGNI